MNIKKFLSLGVLFGIIFSLSLSPGFAAPKAKKEKSAQEAPQRIIIPPQIKSVFEEGMGTRQARPDIPFTIIENYYLPDFPARQNLHSIFLFKVKNADLGFSSLSPEPKKKKKEKEEQEEQIFVSESADAPAMLEATCHVFLQFNRLENNAPADVVREIYIPIKLQAESASYEPDKEEIYSTRNLLPPGNYLLSMAIASAKLDKIGTQYFEFSLPNESSFTDKLGNTPIFLMKRVEQVDAPEMRASFHKDFFTYIIFQIEPNVEKIFSPGDNLEVFFFVFGAQPDESSKYNIEVAYEIRKGEEITVLYSPSNYVSPLIQQALPMQQTVIIKSEEGDKQETRDIEPGMYTLIIKITDKISGFSLEEKIDFEVR